MMRDGETMINQVIPVTLADGFVVEAVYYGSGTLCLSTQVGCAIGCPFCASGSKGFFRNLTLDEINLQVAVAKERFKPERITLSGIGEPLRNWSVVKLFMQSSDIPVSITTTGTPLNRFKELLSLAHNGVMLSLHSGVVKTHQHLIPKGPNLKELMVTLSEEWQQLSRNNKRKIGINYLVVEGLNDMEEEVVAMAAIMKCFPEATLHLLLCNLVEHSEFKSPSDERLQEMYRFFRDQGIHCRRANRWRRKSDGGCGTLMVSALTD